MQNIKYSPFWMNSYYRRGRLLRSGICFDVLSHIPCVFLVRVVNNIHIHIIKIVCWLKPKYMRVIYRWNLRNNTLLWIRLYLSSKSSDCKWKYKISAFTGIFQQSKIMSLNQKWLFCHYDVLSGGSWHWCKWYKDWKRPTKRAKHEFVLM